MSEVREATVDDAAELVRLRREMFVAMHGADEPGEWERTAEDAARRQLAVPEGARRMGAFVVDGDVPATGHPAGHPTAPHLAACAVGTVEERLAAPLHPAGLFGFVFSVCTDSRYRGRGHGRATTEALLDWFAARGVTRVDLHASEEAEHLYRSLGFADHSIPLSLDVSRRE